MRNGRSNGRRSPPPPPPSFLEHHGRTVLYSLVLVAIVAIGAYAVLGGETGNADDNGDDGPRNDPPKTSTAPKFDVMDIEGRPLSLEQQTGKVVVLDLFATWCGPCRTQMGELNKLRAYYTEEQVLIASIDVDTRETIQQIRDFRDEFNADWYFAPDTDGVGQKYSATNIPTMVIIDKDGNMVWTHAGVTEFSEMVARIDPLLA
jgi:thiol-disulfide isomerase/thioredoxin